VRCSALQYVAVCCIIARTQLKSTLHHSSRVDASNACVAVCCSVLQCVAVCCSVLQCFAVCCRVLQCVTVFCRVLPCVAVCYSVLQYVVVCCTWQDTTKVDSSTVDAPNECGVVCCSVLQCVALCCTVARHTNDTSTQALQDDTHKTHLGGYDMTHTHMTRQHTQDTTRWT
jgi:hypothetical protein